MPEFYHLDQYDGNLREQIFSLADYLLNDVDLVSNGKQYHLAEIELYLKSDDHPDPFVHGDEHQKQPGCWYFHRQNGKGYKSGTYKGLDFTFGRSNEEVYGGMLIRAIFDPTTDTLIEGPCNVVNTLIGAKTLEQYVSWLSRRVVPSTIPVPVTKQKALTLVKLPRPRHINTHVSSRVGLTLKKGLGNNRADYLMRPYRFTTHPDKLKKMPSTVFMGEYLRELTRDGTTPERALEWTKTVTNTKTSLANRWLRKYEEGVAMKKVKGYTKCIKEFASRPLSANDMLQLYGICF